MSRRKSTVLFYVILVLVIAAAIVLLELYVGSLDRRMESAGADSTDAAATEVFNTYFNADSVDQLMELANVHVSPFESGEDVFAPFAEKLGQMMTLRCTERRTDRALYEVFTAEEVIATFELPVGGTAKDAENVRVPISLGNNVIITAPDSLTVLINEVPLTEEQAATTAPTFSVGHMPPNSEKDGIYLVTYSVGGLSDTPQISAVDAEGVKYSPTRDGEGNYEFLLQYRDSELRPLYESLVTETANSMAIYAVGMMVGNDPRTYILPDCALTEGFRALRGSKEALYYVFEPKMENTETFNYCAYGEDTFSVNIRFDLSYYFSSNLETENRDPFAFTLFFTKDETGTFRLYDYVELQENEAGVRE